MPLHCALAALVSTPKVNLLRFHGLFGPNRAHRARVTASQAGQDQQGQRLACALDTRSPKRRAVVTWAQRLKLVCNIDMSAFPDLRRGSYDDLT